MKRPGQAASGNCCFAIVPQDDMSNGLLFCYFSIFFFNLKILTSVTAGSFKLKTAIIYTCWETKVPILTLTRYLITLFKTNSVFYFLHICSFKSHKKNVKCSFSFSFILCNGKVHQVTVCSLTNKAVPFQNISSYKA